MEAPSLAVAMVRSAAGRLAMTGGATGVAKSSVTGAHASPEELVARDVWK